VHAYWAARGDADCGSDAVSAMTRVDKNGAPLVVNLGPAVCPAVAVLPPRVLPLFSPTHALTQTVRGERAGLTTRVIVSATGGAVEATLGVTNTWAATINLSPGITNTVGVYGVDFPDTQCESRIGPVEADVNGTPLRVVQLSTERLWLPVVAR
jgi:hypothetical protein